VTQDDPDNEVTAAQMVGRDFATAVVVFHEAVGRLLGLSAVERKCLDLLTRLGPVPAGVIGDHTGLTTGAVTRMVDRLAKAGYVERAPDAHDRRKVLVRALPNQRKDELLALAFGPYVEDLTEIMASYTPEESATIADWVRRTTQALIANTRRINTLEPM
jgi:DNA-binding MarR family transcriptional regulator